MKKVFFALTIFAFVLAPLAAQRATPSPQPQPPAPAQTSAAVNADYFPGIPQNEIYTGTIRTSADWKRAVEMIRQGHDAVIGGGTVKPVPPSNYYKAYHLIIDGDIEVPYETVYINPIRPNLVQHRTFHYVKDGVFYSRNAVIAITGRGKLYITQRGALFWIMGETVIIDGDITLQGIENNYQPLIYLSEGISRGTNGESIYTTGKLELRNGTITGNYNTPDAIDRRNIGGGVFIGNNAFFIMSGGAITGCRAEAGGAVYCENSRLGVERFCFNMTGGTISGNSAVYKGGAVYMHKGNFTMTGGVIKNNTAPAGGGVHLLNAETNINGGSIYGNNAPSSDRNTASEGNLRGHAVSMVLADGNAYNFEPTGKIHGTYYRDTTVSPNDKLTHGRDIGTGSAMQGFIWDFSDLPTAAGQTLNGWTRR